MNKKKAKTTLPTLKVLRQRRGRTLFYKSLNSNKVNDRGNKEFGAKINLKKEKNKFEKKKLNKLCEQCAGNNCGKNIK